MIVLFGCGHLVNLDADRTQVPSCPRCGERRVSRVVDVPPPRFTGHVTGPCATTKDLGPAPAPTGAVPLPPFKES
jgi:hypothetical protein